MSSREFRGIQLSQVTQKLDIWRLTREELINLRELLDAEIQLPDVQAIIASALQMVKQALDDIDGARHQAKSRIENKQEVMA